jgi:hypothetical protein
MNSADVGRIREYLRRQIDKNPKHEGIIVSFRRRDAKYLLAAVDELAPTGRTCRWALVNRGGQRLGTIKWSTAWRCYVLDPAPCSSFSAGCMRDVAAFLDSVRSKRAERARSK